MNTILTDDEMPPFDDPIVQAIYKVLDDTEAAPPKGHHWEGFAARRAAAAVLAKLAQQAPVASVRTWHKNGDQHAELDDWGLGLASIPDGTHNLYTRPAPQQADRQRVPEGWKLVPVVPTSEMLGAADREHAARGLVSIALISYQAMLTAAPEAPTQGEQAAEPVRDEREPSPTAGMTLGQRIFHVGGRTNAAGYVEFGSVQAVDALVRHVLRDLPDAAPAQASAVDERAAFEAWYVNSDGLGVSSAWGAWQARAALAQKAQA